MTEEREPLPGTGGGTLTYQPRPYPPIIMTHILLIALAIAAIIVWSIALGILIARHTLTYLRHRKDNHGNPLPEHEPSR